jgi:hypothetical protein
MMAMATLLPIQSVTRGDLLRVLKKALRGKLDIDSIQDFVASVDWSCVIFDRPAIADTLGAVENLTTMFEEGDITEAEYRSSLLDLFPELTQASARSL